MTNGQWLKIDLNKLAIALFTKVNAGKATHIWSQISIAIEAPKFKKKFCSKANSELKSTLALKWRLDCINSGPQLKLLA